MSSMGKDIWEICMDYYYGPVDGTQADFQEEVEAWETSAKADAWDEGFSKGWDSGHYESGNETNPYRKE